MHQTHRLRWGGVGGVREKETEELKIAPGAAFFPEIIFLPGRFIS